MNYDCYCSFMGCVRLIIIILNLVSLSSSFWATGLWKGNHPIWSRREISDHEVEALIQKRNECRQQRQYGVADQIRSDLMESLIEIKDEIGWKTTWQRVISTSANASSALMEEDLMELTDSLLSPDASIYYAEKVLKFRDFLTHCQLERKVEGRRFADAAFKLAIAGVDNDELFTLLADCTKGELLRFGHRKSCPSRVILEMCEKLVVAGVDTTHPVYSTAVEIITAKEDNPIRNLSVQNFRFSNMRALRWLWRYASNHDKAQFSQRTKTVSSVNISRSLLSNPSLPIILDIGCGFGTTLLTLAKHQEPQLPVNNYLGVDLNQPAVLYASSLTRRWGIHDRCHFLPADVYRVLHHMSSGPYDSTLCNASIALVLVNFPTPFRFNGSSASTAGNRQLPSKEQFLVRRELLESLYKVLDRSPQGSLLLAQTNAEDVAVEVDRLIRDSAYARSQVSLRSFRAVPIEELRARFVSLFPNHGDLAYLQYTQLPVGDDMAMINSTSSKRTRRNDAYISSLQEHANNTQFRAFGQGFLASSPLPHGAMSETEAAYVLDGKPVFRLAYVFQ